MDFLVKDAMENFEGGEESNQIDDTLSEAKILVVGAGGAGNNTITRLSSLGIQGAELIAVNTDKQQLEYSRADKKVLIGYEITKGLGAGGYPEIGRQSALDAKTVLRELLSDADLVFVTCGLGGGTGSGSLPVIAEIAEESGTVVVGAVTMPFKIERARIGKAREALGKLRRATDSVVVIDNNKLLEYVPDLPMNEAFGVADEVLARMVKGISETIAIPSLINLDFADVRAVMENGGSRGVAMIGLGESDSRNRAEEAVLHALENPLLDVDYRGATGALVHITGGPDLTLAEATKIGEIATSYLHSDANVIWGARIDPTFEKKVQVMVIMTGVTSPDIMGASDIQVPMKEVKGLRDLTRPMSPMRLQSQVNSLPQQELETRESIMAKLDIDYII
ncbi:MAG: cell division protein FtsZ [Candidatus Hydrothermarchaeales archaeon]